MFSHQHKLTRLDSQWHNRVIVDNHLKHSVAKMKSKRNGLFCAVILLGLQWTLIAESAFRIGGGKAAALGQFPSAVFLSTSYEKKCSGVIVGPDLFLTAGSCLCREKPEEVTVYIGLINFRSEDKQKYEVMSFEVEPSYWCKGDSAGNDIAGGRVKRPFVLSRNTQIAPIGSYTGPGATVTVAGFGWTYRGMWSGFGILRYASVQTTQCDDIPHAEKAICFKIMQNDVKPWYGDTGGPMYDSGNNVIGVYSSTCRLRDPITMYASVPANMEFLKKVFPTIGQHGRPTSDFDGDHPTNG